MVITVFDARRIQEYIFGSNRLIENIGASYLVSQALNDLPLKAASEISSNYTDKIIEPLYCAGGNSLFMCTDIDIAKIFAREFSTLLHENAPGIEVACFHHQISEENFNTGEEIWNALSGMASSKNEQIAGTPITGFGVTERCASGNEEIAIIKDPYQPNRMLGPAAFGKISNSSQAKEHLGAFLKTELPEDCELPLMLDHLGRSRGEKSYLGVVHIDGNGIGKMLQKKLRIDVRNIHNQQNQIKEIKEYSDKISETGANAVRSIMEQVSSNWDPAKKLYANQLDLHWDTDKAVMYLPFRPIVYGGDDITFVCDGRIALDLAATCLKAFHNQENGLGLYACAGVAIIKSHYPFFRAYRLAEDLCTNAKKAVIDRGINSGTGSAMDWQIISGGPISPIEKLREREYTISGGIKLTCRPYFILPSAPRQMNDWDSFRDGLLQVIQGNFSTDESLKWAEAHSRLKSLMPHINKGPDYTKLILAQWKQMGYRLPDYCNNNLLTSGFDANKTPFVDALELLDFFVPLT